MNTEAKNPDRTPNRRLSMKERRDVFKWMENNRDWAEQRTMKDIFKAFSESHPDIPLTVNGLRQHFNELEYVYLRRDEALSSETAQLVRCDDSPTLALALLVLLNEVSYRSPRHYISVLGVEAAMTNHHEAALRALEQKWRSEAASARARRVQADGVIDRCADELAAVLRQIEAAPSPPDSSQGEPGPFDMLAHLQRQREWSERTFGPGARTAGVVDHIRKELCEVEADPLDLAEWVDVVILALDGAWRCGGSPEQIITGIVAKQTKNEGRQWPDWRTADPDKAIEHTKTPPPSSPQVANTFSVDLFLHS